MTPGGASSGQAHTRNSMRLQQHWQRLQQPPPPWTRISSHISISIQPHSSCSTCRRRQTSFARYPTHRSERTCTRCTHHRTRHARESLALAGTAMAGACVSIKQLHCPRCVRVCAGDAHCALHQHTLWPAVNCTNCASNRPAASGPRAVLLLLLMGV